MSAETQFECLSVRRRIDPEKALPWVHWALAHPTQRHLRNRLLYSRLNCEGLDVPRCSFVQHATAGRVSYRLTPWVPNNQNAEVSHNTIRMANSRNRACRAQFSAACRSFAQQATTMFFPHFVDACSREPD